MDTPQVYAELTPIFREVFDDDSMTPTPQMTAKDVIRWDSLNHINLIIRVEKHFNIRFETAEVIGLANVGEFVAALQKKLP